MRDIAWLPYQSWMNASGTGGYFPGKEFLENFPDSAVFVTNPISLQPRKPAKSTTVVDFEGGFLVHSGWPNPGFSSIIKKYGKLWEKAPLPVIVNLLVSTPDETYHMMQDLEEFDNVFAVELSLPEFATTEFVLEMIDAGFGKLPLILKTPLELLYQPWVKQIPDFPFVEAISLQPPKGIVFKSGKAIRGRLFGPSVLPTTANAVFQLKKYEIPVLAGAGLTNLIEVESLFALGVYGVQFYEMGWSERLNP